MKEKVDGLMDAYYEKPKKLETWSGIPLTKEVFGPEDLQDISTKEEIGEAGQYPYTRGIHKDMYRGKYWTRREVCGFATPKETNERLKFLCEQGIGGLNVIMDIAGHMGLDADHPRALYELGMTGVHLDTILDMEELMDGIPMDKVSMSLITAGTPTPAVLGLYVALAQNQGIDISCLKGTIQNDPLHFRYCGFKPSAPLDLALKAGVDSMEFCTRSMPYWYSTTVNMYDLREQGLTAPQEIAFGFGVASCYIDSLLRRGLDIDSFAPRMAFYCSAHIDLFEEVAKLRAARRMWAKLMKEKYGAKNPQSLTFKFGVHTAGCSLVPQQPLNNIIRIAYEALAAVLGGVQSLHCCSYDEPIALPTEVSSTIALRTQQILAYETGVANVTDPLGGSYYVEWLTNQLEERAWAIMKEIEEVGGMMEAMRSEWIDREFEKSALKIQKEVENKERLMVGVNIFTSPWEEKTPGGVQRVSSDTGQKQAERLRKFKAQRNQKKLREAIEHLREEARIGPEHNLMPSVIEAVKVYATVGEVMGTIREAFGYSYDPLGVVPSPFS